MERAGVKRKPSRWRETTRTEPASTWQSMSKARGCEASCRERRRTLVRTEGGHILAGESHERQVRACRGDSTGERPRLTREAPKTTERSWGIARVVCASRARAGRSIPEVAPETVTTRGMAAKATATAAVRSDGPRRSSERHGSAQCFGAAVHVRARTSEETPHWVVNA